MAGAQRRSDIMADLLKSIRDDVADRDYLVNRVLPKINTRGLQAVLDALFLAERDGTRPLGT